MPPRTGEPAIDRDRPHVLDIVVKDRQLMAKDVASLILMLDVETTRTGALSALGAEGEEAASAIPRLVELLKSGDQLDCCSVLRALQRMGPAARDATSAVRELANDQDSLIRHHARAALRAIAPERAAD
jgi:hypothetical protein